MQRVLRRIAPPVHPELGIASATVCARAYNTHDLFYWHTTCRSDTTLSAESFPHREMPWHCPKVHSGTSMVADITLLSTHAHTHTHI